MIITMSLFCQCLFQFVLSKLEVVPSDYSHRIFIQVKGDYLRSIMVIPDYLRKNG